jgi:uncharacterized protein (DUF1697 family)
MTTTTYVAFVRAINVGGRGIVRMADLKQLFESAGARNVRTFIQSGNVVFDAPEPHAARIVKKLRTALGTLLGVEPEIVLRPLADLERIIKRNPFKRFAPMADLKFYVAFLSRPPARTPKLPVTSVQEAVDAIAVADCDVFIVSRRKHNGFYGFPNGIAEKEFGVPATSRSWSTVTKIVSFANKS